MLARSGLGGLHLTDAAPCQRCNVPARDPQTGTADPAFIRRFIADRAIALAQVEGAKQMGIRKNSYVASMNTRADGAQLGKVISVGDTMELSGKRADRHR